MEPLRTKIASLAPVALAAIGLLLGSLGATAQDQKIDVTSLVRETQKVSNEPGEMNFVWWLPEEYWKASMAANPNSSPAQVETLIKVVHPYFLVGVGSGKVGPFAAITFRTDTDIRGVIQLKDTDGTIYKPLPDDKLDPSVPALLALMKPILSRAVGSLGENIHFYVFPGSKKDGARVCDPAKEGACEVSLGERSFKWKLPLGSLLPVQKCPTCGETLSGAYKYCPFDGTKLGGTK